MSHAPRHEPGEKREPTDVTPRWVKIFAAVAVVLVLLVVVLLVVGGGHGPRRHSSAGGHGLQWVFHVGEQP